MPERSDDANACLVSDRFSNRNKSALHEMNISPLTDIVDESTWISLERKAPQRRRIGFLFQDYALFSHLTVAANIRYGLRSLSTNEQRLCLAELLRRFQLQELAERYPHQVSGGQKQSVALARPLAPQPRLLLLDEPLSALDGPTREALRGELRSVLRSLSVPVLPVTHDRGEALALGDQVAIVNDGRIAQHGPVEEVFRRPLTPAIARIVAVETVQRARVLQADEELVTVAVGETRLVAAASLAVVQRCLSASEQRMCSCSKPRNRLPLVLETAFQES